MTIKPSILLAGIVMALSSAAAERQIKFEDPDYETYTLTFEDTKISESALRKLAWLSPYSWVAGFTKPITTSPPRMAQPDE
jgi:hypothetical protein